MATVNIANLTFTHRGNYDGSTAYSKNDVVYYSTNGNAYIAKQATTGNAPTNGTYWSQFAAGSGGIWNAGLSLGSEGQVVKVSSGALAFGTITTKLLGQKITQYHEALNLGNRNKTDTGIISGLTLTYGAPVSTNSYFVARAHIHGSHDDNHMRGYLEYSVDGGSNWVADGWTTGTQSGASLNWTSSDKYEYPHMSWEYNTDDNRQSTASCAVLYQPSVPHSISDFRVRVVIFCNDSTTNCMINRTTTQTSEHGNSLLSSLEVIEYST